MNYGVTRIAGHEEDFEPRPDACCLGREFAAVHSGQYYIRQKKIDPLTLIVEYCERWNCLLCFQHLVIQISERLQEISANVVIVFNDQNSLAALAANRLPRWRLCCLFGFRGELGK